MGTAIYIYKKTLLLCLFKLRTFKFDSNNNKKQLIIIEDYKNTLIIMGNNMYMMWKNCFEVR